MVKLGYQNYITIDFGMVKHLNYYTGIIFEAKSNIGNLSSSILGGGRYDDLTGIFDLPNVSGVGISFGIDRIYDVMEESHLFPTNLNKTYPAQVLLAYLDEKYLKYVLEIAQKLRKAYISTDIYHQVDKMRKIMDYANKKAYLYVGIIGDEEFNNQSISLKDMYSGHQEVLSIEKIIEKLNT